MNIAQLRLLLAELERVEISINILQQTANEFPLSDAQQRDRQVLERRRAEILAMEITK